jgi:methylmalonyl-CoA mutase N-terminal domain/subunit
VEQLTDAIEARAVELIARVDALGGAADAIKAGFFQEEIGRSAYEYQLRVEAGETVVVGVNKFGDGQDPPIIPAPDFSALEREQVAQLSDVKAKRDQRALASALAAVGDVAVDYLPAHTASTNGSARRELMPRIIDAVRLRASVGEIADALERVWGRYQPSM